MGAALRAGWSLTLLTGIALYCIYQVQQYGPSWRVSAEPRLTRATNSSNRAGPPSESPRT